METSISIAQLLWPIMWLIWIRLLFNSDIFSESKSWLKNEKLSVMISSVWGLIAWILILKSHNIWTWEPWIILISLLWWLIFIKSAILIAVPQLFEKIVEKINYPNWLIKVFWVLYILIWICFTYRWFFI